VGNNVQEELSASIFRVVQSLDRSEDGGRKLVRNVDACIPVYVVSCTEIFISTAERTSCLVTVPIFSLTTKN